MEWCTQSYNEFHAYRIGLAKPRGKNLSIADRLLKKNGFNLCSIEELKYKKQTRQWREEGNIEICFNESQTIDIVFNGEVSGNLPAFINMEELKAIYLKCQELGWIE